MHVLFMQAITMGPSTEMIQAQVLAVAQSVLGSAPDVQQPLMAAGLDSLGAVELRNSLQTRFSLQDLPATLIFDHPSVSAISAYLTGEYSAPPKSKCLHLQ